ncbi:MAG TPA: DUF2079 domain-containing protein [Acidimicrobiia bacterium]|nr:DUF2079 domain-containing protein [Acidimicrobiia bacterium]
MTQAVEVDTDPEPTPEPAPRLGWRDPVRWVLGAMVAGWGVLFIVLGWIRQTRFATFSFDLGIYDQAVWLLSRFHDPFVTVRGLEFFGHHVNPIVLLFVPFYWLGAGPLFLLSAQVLVQASGAIAIYLLARDRIHDRWLAVALAAVLLLNPTYQWLTWEFFHPDALAIAPLLFAYWAARTERWKWFVVFAVLAAACKEDVALALAVIGLLIALRGHRKIGVLTLAASIAWYMIATRVVIPLSNGIGPFYDTFFGDLGKNPIQVGTHLATHPKEAVDLATQPDRVSYYEMMFAPVAFLPLVALPTLLIAGPMLAVNVFSSFPYTREIRYHYSSLVLVGIILATVEAIAWVAVKRPGLVRFLVGLVVATSLAATVAWGPSPISVKYRTGIWPLQSDRQSARDAAVDVVPDGAPTSAIYNLLPHLAHRDEIYDFPVPWRNVNWGVHGEHLADPAGVQWLAVDRREMSTQDLGLLEKLLAHQFRVVFDRDDIVVAKRVHPPPRR